MSFARLNTFEISYIRFQFVTSKMSFHSCDFSDAWRQKCLQAFHHWRHACRLWHHEFIAWYLYMSYHFLECTHPQSSVPVSRRDSEIKPTNEKFIISKKSFCDKELLNEWSLFLNPYHFHWYMLEKKLVLTSKSFQMWKWGRIWPWQFSHFEGFLVGAFLLTHQIACRNKKCFKLSKVEFELYKVDSNCLK